MAADNYETRTISDGDEIEIPKWLSHGQMKAVQRILTQSRKNETEMDIQTNLINMLVRSWTIRDEDGSSLPVNNSGIEKVPQTKINEVFSEITKLIEAATPNS